MEGSGKIWFTKTVATSNFGLSHGYYCHLARKVRSQAWHDKYGARTWVAVVSSPPELVPTTSILSLGEILTLIKCSKCRFITFLLGENLGRLYM